MQVSKADTVVQRAARSEVIRLFVAFFVNEGSREIVEVLHVSDGGEDVIQRDIHIYESRVADCCLLPEKSRYLSE